MAIVNRDLDVSQQKDVVQHVAYAQSSNGSTLQVALIAFPCVLQSVSAAAYGLSGAHQLTVKAERHAGGQTYITMGISNLVLGAYGTSGAIGYSGLAAEGSTLLNLQAGDVLFVEGAAANTAAAKMVLEVVLKKTQDIVSHNGRQS